LYLWGLVQVVKQIKKRLPGSRRGYCGERGGKESARFDRDGTAKPRRGVNVWGSTKEESASKRKNVEGALGGTANLLRKVFRG